MSRGPGCSACSRGEPRRSLRAVDDVSFAIPRGKTLSLVGESGCGKSTVARLAVGLYAPSGGEIRFEGQDLSAARAQPALRRRMNMIFQDPYASLNPRWRVRDIVAEPIRAFGLLQRPPARSPSASASCCTRSGWRRPTARNIRTNSPAASASASRSPARLSSEPEFLVCDEPTSALDVSVQAQILNLMSDLQRGSASPICSSATTSPWSGTCRTGWA